MSHRLRTALSIAIALSFSAGSAAALQLASQDAAAGSGDQPEQSRRPDTPPGHDRRPENPGQPGNGGGGGDEDPGDPTDPSLVPMDYIAQASQLSQAEYPEIVTEVLELEAHDGETLYVEITRPDPAEYGDDLELPVILEASPYHGTLADRAGTRIFPDPVDEDGSMLGLTGYFAPRGYAVAMMDLRGTGRSTGCLDHLGGDDAQDLVTVIESLAGAEWSNGNVGMTGHSYVGSTPAVAAAMEPEGLVTIAPSAGLASMYDHQFHNGVPWLLQWVGPMIAYEGLALERDFPPGTPGIPVVTSGNSGDNWEHRGGPNPQTGCGLPNTAAISGTGQLTGQYQDWHAERDWAEGAAAADIPIFMIHGVHDNAARIPASGWFFGGRYGREGDKVWIGQWDHGSTNGRCGDEEGMRALHPTCRFEQFQYAVHAWFDHHLKGLDVDTGPAVEAFLNGEQAVDITAVLDPETLGAKVYATDAWREATSFLELHPDATDMSLRTSEPEQAGSASFSTAAEAVLANVGRGTVSFGSDPMEDDTVVLGVSDLVLHASVTNPTISHLVASLWRVDPEGNREPVDFCAIQPGLRDGIDMMSPVIPGEVMALDLQCFTVAAWIPAGHHLELDISTGSQHHASFGNTNQVTVHTGPDLTRYQAPLVTDAVLHDDVPLRERSSGDGGGDPVPAGPAQAPVEGSVTVLAPGGGVIVEPITAASFEFDVEEGFDNARIEVLATPMAPADIDLYLQRQADDGTWGSDIAAGESGDLDKETLVAGRQAPGRYRIVVHSWAGTPNQVDLLITFVNSEGEPGT
jgi:uncharacterized protein